MIMLLQESWSSICIFIYSSLWLGAILADKSVRFGSLKNLGKQSKVRFYEVKRVSRTFSTIALLRLRIWLDTKLINSCRIEWDNIDSKIVN